MEVSFQKATYRNRIFAFAVDFFLFLITILFLMIASNKIVTNLTFYKNANAAINQLEVSSHLYVERKDGNVQLMCDFYQINEEDDYQKYSEKFDSALTSFFTDPAFFTDPEEGMKTYNLLKIPEGNTQSELFMYSDSSHTTVVNKDTATYKDLYDFYCDIMADEAVKYVTSSDIYLNNSKTIIYSFVFLEALIPIVVSSLIYELIIPLCISRGKKTLGKLMFNIAVVDNRGLSCPWPRFLCRYLLKLIVETLLSFVAILIPVIVSFTMFILSKTGQSFHDYVTNTYVIEAPLKSICKTEEEYYKKHEHDKNFTLKAHEE